MGLIVKENFTKTPPVPTGMHQAICFGVADIGTQVIPNSKFPPKRKAVIFFELPNERMDLEKNGSVQNVARTLSKKVTLSLSQKGTLRKILKSWRGRDMLPAELEAFDMQHLITQNATLNVVHENGVGQKANQVFANIQDVLPAPRGLPKTAPENAPLFFSLNDQQPGNVLFPPNMPDWCIELCMASEEYKNLAAGRLIDGGFATTNTTIGNTKTNQQDVRDAAMKAAAANGFDATPTSERKNENPY